MKRFGLIRGGTRTHGINASGTRPIGPGESRFSLYLTRLIHHAAGRFTIGHYVADPAERPSHVFRHSSRFLTFTQEAFETSLSTLTEITEEESAGWKPSAQEVECEHVIILSDECGNVILRESCPADEARRVMVVVGNAAKRVAERTE